MLVNMISNSSMRHDLAIREQLVRASLLVRHADDGPYARQRYDGAGE
jgi:hypothetical protein